MNKKAVSVSLLLLFLLSLLIFIHSNEKKEGDWNTYVLSELRFQDNITEKALNYAQSFHPDWQWSVATLCLWPNNTVTVLIYGNYTINCRGLTCPRNDGLLYEMNLNLTSLRLLSFKKAPPNAYDELIDRCEKVGNETEKKGLDYRHTHLSKKCRILTSCPWPNGTITFLFHVNYTTVCGGYNCEDESGVFYEVTFDSRWRVLSVRRVPDEYTEFRTRCNLEWLSLWKNESKS
ncbi:hypothetical protein [Thermococcus sp.]